MRNLLILCLAGIVLFLTMGCSGHPPVSNTNHGEKTSSYSLHTVSGDLLNHVGNGGGGPFEFFIDQNSKEIWGRKGEPLEKGRSSGGTYAKYKDITFYYHAFEEDGAISAIDLTGESINKSPKQYIDLLGVPTHEGIDAVNYTSYYLHYQAGTYEIFINYPDGTDNPPSYIRLKRK